MHGLSADLPRLRSLLAQQPCAAAGCSPEPALWRDAQLVVLQHSLRGLVGQLERMPPPCTDQARRCTLLDGRRPCQAPTACVLAARQTQPPERPIFTATPAVSSLQAKPTTGVSYVVGTESRQAGVTGLARLPHLGAPAWAWC